MKKIIYSVGIISLLWVFSNCNKQENINNKKTNSVITYENNDTDIWIKKYLTDTLNISVLYKAQPFNNLYFPNNSIAESHKVLSALKCIKIIWLDNLSAYKDVEFTKEFSPRQIMVMGSPNYTPAKVEIISTKLGGIIAPIFNINQFDSKSEDAVYRLCRQYGYAFGKSLLEYKPANLEKFAGLNKNEYNDWTIEKGIVGLYDENSDNEKNRGFFSRGAQKNVIDDFCESFSILMCKTPNEIKSLVFPSNEYVEQTEGQKILEKKMIFIDKYLKDNFDINRKIFLNREISKAIKQYPNSVK